MKIRLLLLSMIALARTAAADQTNPLADFPWQQFPGQWYNWPWQGYTLTVRPDIVSEPDSPGSLFESINWFQHQDNLNAGAAIEWTPVYTGLFWYDFIGGHHILSSDNQIYVNEPLPLRLSYVELTFGSPGPDHTAWLEIPASEGRIGLGWRETDPTIGGWVTQVNLYTKSVPDAGATLPMLGLALTGLLMLVKPTK